MLAGYETTSTALCFVSQFLALNPEFQEKLIKEIDIAFGKETDIDYEKLMKSEYLDAFIKETLRITCSVNRLGLKPFFDCLNY
jgi:cytochrome P450